MNDFPSAATLILGHIDGLISLEMSFQEEIMLNVFHKQSIPPFCTYHYQF